MNCIYMNESAYNKLYTEFPCQLLNIPRKSMYPAKYSNMKRFFVRKNNG